METLVAMILFACVSVVSLLHVGWIAWMVVQHRKDMIDTLAMHVRALTSLVRSATSRPERDPLEQHIARIIEERRLGAARRFVSQLSGLVLFGMIVILRNQINGVERWMSPWQDFLALAAYIVLVFFTVFPKAFTSESLHFFNSLTMLFIILVMQPWRTRSIVALAITNMFALTISFAAGMMYLRWSFSTVGNCIIAATFVYMYQHSSDAIKEKREYMYLQGILLAMLTFILRSFEASATNSARRELEATMSRNERSAVNSLLDIMCDAVVELDEELAVSKHAPKLSGLMLHSAGKNLVGLKLQQFMPSEEDVQHFKACMEVSGDGLDMTAKLFHSRLRDSMGTVICVSVFRVPFLSLEKTVVHLLGLQERSDGIASSEESAVHITGSWTTAPAQAVDKFPTNVQMSPASSMAVSEQSDQNVLQIDFDAFGSLPILYFSKRFDFLYGPIKVGDSFLACLPDGPEFLEWLTEHVEAAHAGNLPPGMVTFGSVALLPGPNGGSTSTRKLSVFFPSPAVDQASAMNASSQRRPYSVSVRLGKSLSRPIARESRKDRRHELLSSSTLSASVSL